MFQMINDLKVYLAGFIGFFQAFIDVIPNVMQLAISIMTFMYIRQKYISQKKRNNE